MQFKVNDYIKVIGSKRVPDGIYMIIHEDQYLLDNWSFTKYYVIVDCYGYENVYYVDDDELVEIAEPVCVADVAEELSGKRENTYSTAIANCARGR